MKIIKLTKNKLETINIEKKLDNYYKQLNCSIIDIVTVKINNKQYDLIIDDEGKLKDHEPILLFLDKDHDLIDYIATSCLICNSKETKDGIEEDSLTEQDIKDINIYFKKHNTSDYFYILGK